MQLATPRERMNKFGRGETIVVSAVHGAGGGPVSWARGFPRQEICCPVGRVHAAPETAAGRG